ncbi:MAG: hypothetical protein DLM53_03685 [Candidatus Eremiobacter antarcticus]|nr:hypothetical protein [Candidatus Eremiobacteraeota bacterium]MBC5807374.1 hypothetical protein [Candidatus Eremiobacteraeota bacterium]PZR63126.1 MAG: hypothetical protein DLM53_03685 [Candidatus Eremiobacter sp. RRmetagenome_bin22]
MRRSTSVKPAPSKTVVAERFEIQDRHGNIRALLSCDDDDNPSLRLLDATGQVRVLASLEEDRPRFLLIDSVGLTRLCLILRQNRPGIEFVDEKGTRRLLLYLRATDHNSGDIVFMDNHGKPRLAMTISTDGAILIQGEDELGRLVEPMWFAKDVAEKSDPEL